MKTPELGFGGSNSAYNLEKGPRVRAQPFGIRGPLRRAAPRRAGAARRHLPREVRQPGVTPLSKALYPESALRAEVPGFFIGFSAATTRSSLASPAPVAILTRTK